MRRVTPDYQRRLVYVLPPSGYNLRRNHDPGVLLMSHTARTKKTLRNRWFSYSAPRLWNPLPFIMRSLSSLTTLKVDLKLFLFSKAFNKVIYKFYALCYSLISYVGRS